MRVTKIAETMVLHKQMVDSSDGQFTPEDIKGEDLIEFAGRACYQSWDRPNEHTAANSTYINHLINVGHTSVLYHASVSFYITEVSRSLTHELVRHAFLNPSQLSQRFVNVDRTLARAGVDDIPYVVPPLYLGDAEANTVLSSAWDYAIHAYDRLIEIGETRVKLMVNGGAGGRTTALKRVREAARAVLPNMTPTAIVVTGNHQAWRAFIMERSAAGADLEIRDLARKIYEIVRTDHPALYQDMNLMADGSICADGGWRG